MKNPRLTPVFGALVALAACSASESSTQPLTNRLAPLNSSPAGTRDGANPSAASSAVVASALPEASSPLPGSSEPPADDMVYVPAGSFWMGCAQGDPSCREDEKPRHKVTLDAFQIDRLEVTVEQYRTCLHVGACKATMPGIIFVYPGGLRDPTPYPKDCNFRIAGRSNHGMNCLDPGEAREYCRWLGKRMPTEAEWERAARGTDDRIYPWGNEPPDLTRICPHASCPVGSFPDGASPSGALDMGGNLAEWVSDTYTENYYSHSPAKNPRGPEPIKVPYWLWCHTVQCQAVRGRTARVSERWGVQDQETEEIGFRCARDAPQQPSVAP